MPSRREIVTFQDAGPPPGESPWVPGATPSREIVIVDPDPAWPQRYVALACRIRDVLGARAIQLQHVGSTSVPGLPAKPIIDIDLIVADPADEAAYVPALASLGYELRVREPWWYQHRALRRSEPASNLHVHGCDSPEPIRTRMFRDWLRANADDRELYAAAKREAAAEATVAGEHVMEYNARKQRVIREIYGRVFRAAGLLP